MKEAVKVGQHHGGERIREDAVAAPFSGDRQVA